MPRLAPRRPRHRSGELGTALFCEMETTDISFSQSDNTENDSCGDPIPSLHAQKLQHQNLRLYQRRVLSDKVPSYNYASLSPRIGSSSESPTDPLKSPMTNESFCSDFSVTPPVSGPPPLVISSKRVGQDVRREHSKRRRASRRVDSSDSGLNLWNQSSSQESSDDENEDLPFLFPQECAVSPGEQTKQYWEWCYGKEQSIEHKPEQSWSAKRAPPTKGCLFYDKQEHSPSARYKTPPASPLRQRKRSGKQKKNVQFGVPQAAEYEIDEPPLRLTPMPSEVTRARYSMDQRDNTEDEEEATQETKQNSALLAQWDEDFEESRSSARRRRKDRRSSGRFTPSPILNDENSDDEHVLSSAFSPSVEITENLALMRMNSPAAVSAATLEENKEGMPFPSRPQPQQQKDTIDFGVSLDAINSTGGAMGISPPQRSLSTPAETTPPPPTMTLEGIHSVGGAMGIESPAKGNVSSFPPVSMMELCEGDKEEEKLLTRPRSNDIVKTLLKDPSADQEWALTDLLANLICIDGSKVESVLAAIDCKQNGVIACLDDFCARTKYRSQSKPKLNAENASDARKTLSSEWKELEVEAVEDLNRVLASRLSKVVAMSQRAKSMKWPQSSKRAKEHCALKSIERDILNLQESILRETEVLLLNDASQAPYSALRCQATFGIAGCRLDACTGGTLSLSFEHVVEGLESILSFDLIAAGVTASWRHVGSPFRQPIPSNHDAARFHEFFLELLANGSLPLLQELNVSELQDSVLTFSRWLGHLDLATSGLYSAAISGKATFVIEMPLVRLLLPWGVQVHFDFAAAEGFLPSAMTYYGKGNTGGEDLEMPPGTTFHNLFQKILEDCSK